VADEEAAAPDVSTVEEEEFQIDGEKEEYNAADEQTEENWED